LVALYPSVTSSHPISLASFMSRKDPSSDIFDRLVAKSGLDKNYDLKKPDSSRSALDIPTVGSRFNVGSIDVEAVPNTGSFPQEEPMSSAASWTSSVSSAHQSSIKNLYSDMADSSMQAGADQWGEFDESGAEKLSHGFRNSDPKEVVKVLHQDVVSKRPVPTSSVNHLRKTVQKYSSDVESTSMEGSTPAPLSSLPKLYLHHGKRSDSRADQQVDHSSETEHLLVHPEDMVTYHLSKVAPPENPSPESLARSLRAHVQAEKTKERKEVVERMAETKQEEPVVSPSTPNDAEEVDANSPMNSLHRHPKHQKLKYKVQPEDIQYTSTTVTTTISTIATTTTTRTAEKLQTANSAQSEWDVLFNANAVDDHLDADGVEQVLRKMANIKNPAEFNWRRFDLDGDGRLSRREFVNARQVAMRFRTKR